MIEIFMRVWPINFMMNKSLIRGKRWAILYIFPFVEKGNGLAFELFFDRFVALREMGL